MSRARAYTGWCSRAAPGYPLDAYARWQPLWSGRAVRSQSARGGMTRCYGVRGPKFTSAGTRGTYADSFVLFHDALTQLCRSGGRRRRRSTCATSSASASTASCASTSTTPTRRVAPTSAWPSATSASSWATGPSRTCAALDSEPLRRLYETAMRQNVAHTHILPHNHDEEKLLLGTPAEVQRTMLRTWPLGLRRLDDRRQGHANDSSARIVEAIRRFTP